MQRRDFLRAAPAGVVVAQFPRAARAAGIANRYPGIESGKYLTDLKVLAKVPGDKVFTEGPCCDLAGNVFFTNTQGSAIHKWDGRELTLFRQDRNAANGLLFDRDGRLVACEGGAGRVTSTNVATGKVSLLTDSYQGHPLGAPNDLCFDNQGRIYFTSRMTGMETSDRNVNAVYRIDPDGKVHRILHAPDIHMPNGLVTSPDDRTFYLIEADGKPDRNRCILAYDLSRDGTVSKPRKLIDFYPGRSGDGMAIDEQGNLYVAAGLHKPRDTSETLDTRPGIHVISPQGNLLDFVETPEDTITNCRFGGADLKTLYITCGSLLMNLRTQIAGKALYRPERQGEN